MEHLNSAAPRPRASRPARSRHPSRPARQAAGPWRAPSTRITGALLLAAASILPSVASAQGATPAFHFESVCRSDPATSKNTVTVVLHGPDVKYPDGSFGPTHSPLPDVTINVLWTYVDYRQNRAVFKYRQDSCTTNARGSCTFNGGSGRARWQLAEVVGHELSAPAFDAGATVTCPNTLMIDFW